MTNFVRAANPIWFFVDLTGLPLNDEYWIFFLENTVPYDPQLVYQDNQGMTPWSDPVQFLSNGTLPDNIYYNDGEIYRLEVRHGPLQSDPLIYEVNDFVPDNGGSSTSSSGSQENQISNSQFAFVDFTIQPSINATDKTLSITTAGTYQIGADWSLVLTGAGSATVTQVIYTGDENTVADPVPPYALKIETTGWTTAILYQRFNGVAAIWANTFVSMSILARSDNDIASPITLNYAPSSPGTLVPIVSGIPLSTGSFQIVQGSIALPVSTNTARNDVSYVDMQIVLPGTASIELSNVQVMGHDTILPAQFSPEPDETIERQLDHEFHYYANSLIIQPKDSILTGWNFPLNPWQIRTSALTTIASQCSYITDQTILYQSTASSVAVGKASFANNSALTITSILGTNIFALIQYIDPNTVIPYWGSILSSLVKAKLVSGVSPTSIKFKMRLIYRATLPSTLGTTEPIASIDSNGNPVFSAGWTALSPINDPAYVLGTSLSDYSFNGFQMPASSAAAMTLGIVLYTTSNMSTSTPDSCIFEEISLVPNAFAIESNPLSWDETFRRCQFYYESSYNSGKWPGDVAAEGQYQVWQYLLYTGSGFMLYASPFDLQFKNIKRASNPTITLYNPETGASDNAIAQIYSNGALDASNTNEPVSTNWNRIIAGTHSAQYVPLTSGSLLNSSALASSDPTMGILRFQTIIDSRLGV